MKSSQELTYDIVEEFEDKVKNYYGFPYAISVPSASLGYLLLSLCLNNKIFNTTIFTWYSTITPFYLNGFKLKFNFLNPLFQNINLKVKRKEILNLCNFRGIPFSSGYLKSFDCVKILDNSQGFGSINENGKPAGSEADIMVLSFNDEKDMALGGGGIILFKEPEIYKKAFVLSRHPDEQIKKIGTSPNFFYINFKINRFAAKLGIRNFERKLKEIKERQERIMPIILNLSEKGFIKKYPENIIPSFWKEVLCLWNEKPRWKELIRYLKEKRPWNCNTLYLPELGFIWRYLDQNIRKWLKENLNLFFILYEQN